MKINIDLPWGGKLEFEKTKSGDSDTLYTVFIAIVLIGGFILLLSAK